jgi:hypothetical protein
MAKKRTTRRAVLVEKAVRELIFARVARAHRGEQILRIDGDVFGILDAVAKAAITKQIDRAIEMHPSKFKTLQL